MLLSILVVLTVYLLACYAYGAALLIRRGLALRKARTADSQPEASPPALTHRYPAASGKSVTAALAGKAAA